MEVKGKTQNLKSSFAIVVLFHSCLQMSPFHVGSRLDYKIKFQCTKLQLKIKLNPPIKVCLKC